MKIAHIVPITCLHAIPEEASAHLALSNLVTDSIRYAGYYRKQVRDGKLVILDNPVHEDIPNDLERFVNAVLVLHPTVAILPDIIDDIPGTLESAQKAITQCQSAIYRERNPHGSLPDQPQYMAVPHGFTTEEFVDTAAKLIAIPGVTWLGITLERRLKDDPLALARRAERVLALSADPRFNGIRFHLLGLSERASELAPYNEDVFDRVVSVDTSKFAVLALNGIWAWPVPPLPMHYPGRESLGPRNAYFHYRNPSDTILPHLTEQLRTWSFYAERND
jgi:hypothetical protein